MADDKGIITGHFMSHWGVPKEIRTRQVQGIRDFAIIEFAPKGTRTTWRYATNGMSSYRQAYPDENVTVRTELYASTKQQAAWIDDLLAAIASYPQDFGTYLAEGDTINVGQPIDRKSSCFTCILLAPPDLTTLGLVAGLPENVLVHRVVGLLPNEAEFAEVHGSGKLLWQKLMSMGDLVLDEKRISVV